MSDRKAALAAALRTNLKRRKAATTPDRPSPPPQSTPTEPSEAGDQSRD